MLHDKSDTVNVVCNYFTMTDFDCNLRRCYFVADLYVSYEQTDNGPLAQW